MYLYAFPFRYSLLIAKISYFRLLISYKSSQKWSIMKAMFVIHAVEFDYSGSYLAAAGSDIRSVFEKHTFLDWTPEVFLKCLLICVNNIKKLNAWWG